MGLQIQTVEILLSWPHMRIYVVDAEYWSEAHMHQVCTNEVVLKDMTEQVHVEL